METADFFDQIQLKIVACIGGCKDGDDPVDIFKREYPEYKEFPYLRQYVRIAYCKPQYLKMKKELLKLLDSGEIISFHDNFEGRWPDIDVELYHVAVMEIDGVRQNDGFVRNLDFTPNPDWKQKCVWLDFKIEEMPAL